MINLNPYAISNLVIILAYFPLFLFILLKGRNKLARIYALHILCVFLWGTAGFFIALNQNPDHANTLWNCAYIPVMFISTFFIHAILILTRTRIPLLIIFSYAQSILFTYCLLTNKMVLSYRFFFDSFYVMDNTTFWYRLSVIMWELLVLIAHIILILRFKNSEVLNERRQILFVFIAGVGFVGGTMNFLPNLGFDIYPIGNFLIPIHSFFLSYAIFKFRLLNLNIDIKKSFVYSLLIIILMILYGISVLIFEKSMQNYLGYKSLFISILIAFAVGLLIVPLRNLIQNLIDKLFFNASPFAIAEQNELLKQEIQRTDKLKTITTLASGLAHEARNPLSVLKTFTEYLPQRINDPDFIKKYVNLVPKEIDRIDSLIHELLNYAKPTTELKTRNGNLNEVIDYGLTFLSDSFLRQKIHIERNLSTNLPRYPIDSNKMKQAFLNIFLNAMEAMPNGGTLTVSTDVKDKWMRVIIEDTGIGLKKEDLRQIFDPFFSKKDHGTGLGLTITHSIIKSHNGTILVESECGEGTKFLMMFPLENNSVG